MKFRLVFEGEIPPRQQTSADIVHGIRLSLAPQLRALWTFLPLAEESREWLKHPDENEKSYAIFEQRGNTIFAPIVSKRNDLQCELEVLFLRRQSPGQLIGDGGDIDNRLKTLLDALSVPPPAQSGRFSVMGPSDLVFCLLQDDALVTRLSVETDRLLRPTASQYDLVAIIQVYIRASRVTFGTIGLMG
ncbi:hypothetical protein [Bradyrhizobium sp. SZCCHNR1098]|uniref:hypothetical protein n=1 Tax=Bradyrhizobium sp. SZCCHNR1098 TaxID=3057370 RepID=UPI002915C8F4|nr:hypothetical protein [Bradyrhizobium sp. SZCCHNR1098]